jgi:hypothetical protein
MNKKINLGDSIVVKDSSYYFSGVVIDRRTVDQREELLIEIVKLYDDIKIGPQNKNLKEKDLLWAKRSQIKHIHTESYNGVIPDIKITVSNGCIIDIKKINQKLKCVTVRVDDNDEDSINIFSVDNSGPQLITVDEGPTLV